MPKPKTSEYYRDAVRFKHPEIPLEEAAHVVSNPVRTVTQDDGKVRYYGEVTFIHNGEEIKKYARVITLPDGETIDNAFIDREFSDLMEGFKL